MTSPLRYLFPKNCIFCGRSLSVGEPIDVCGDCGARIPYFAGEYLFYDGRDVTVGRGSGGNRVGGGSGVRADTCNRIVCALKYTDFVRSAISGYKFHDRREYGPTLAALLCERIMRAEGTSGGGNTAGISVGKSAAKGDAKSTGKSAGDIRNAFDFVTCIPLSRKRLRERGYNQAAILAGYAARFFDLPYEGKLLAREEDTLRQSALRRGERYANVQSAFRVDEKRALKLLTRKPLAGAQTGSVLNGARIILIDDVATSMSTINACAAALKKQGAAEVLGAVLASPDVGIYT